MHGCEQHPPQEGAVSPNVIAELGILFCLEGHGRSQTSASAFAVRRLNVEHVGQFLFERGSVTPRAKTSPPVRPGLREHAAGGRVAPARTYGASMSNEINRADGGLGWLLRAHYDGFAREPFRSAGRNSSARSTKSSGSS